MNFDNLPPLDIKSFMQTAVWILFIASGVSFFGGMRRIRKARDVGFFSIKRVHISKGYQSIFLSFFFLFIAIILRNFGEPFVYNYIPITNTLVPTATVTLTPSITVAPTITLTPSITLTPAESYTPSPTFTPNIPAAIEVQFSGGIEPPAEAAFSPIIFSEEIDALYRPVRPDTTFTNPIDKIYANYSYAQIVNGVQWTALWYREGELVYFETSAWDGGSGGYGYSDWHPNSSEWLPGNYIVHIFLGLEIKVSANFIVVGDPATETLTPTVTPTVTNTATTTPTLVPSFTATMTPTNTRWPSLTPITPSPTKTRWPTATEDPN
jgi:hypothetical protein